MYVVIPHVGKSHLTYQTLGSIPDENRVILVDGSYVADLDFYAEQHTKTVEYVRPEPLQCLAHNWNVGAGHVPESEPFWMFCASDIAFHRESWVRMANALKNYPDAGIIRDSGTNWNVWVVRRWAWNLLAPMDEGYKPCGGEDDEVVMRCQHAGIKIRAHRIGVNHLEGGHATRIDTKRKLAGTTWEGRNGNVRRFRERWGCVPSKTRDPKYKAAMAATHISEKRSEPPSTDAWNGHSIPTSRKPWPGLDWPKPIRLNIGSGRKPIDGWLNADIDPNAKTDLCFDASKPGEWPFSDGEVDRIESYHVIEHMSRVAGQRFVRAAFRALKSSGTLVIECPDLQAICDSVSGGDIKRVRNIYGDQRTEWRLHRWGYTIDTLTNLLLEAGFGQTIHGLGTDYHARQEPCIRVEATKVAP